MNAAVRAVDAFMVTGADLDVRVGSALGVGAGRVQGRTAMGSRTEPGPRPGLVGEGPLSRVERRRVPRHETSGHAVAHVRGGGSDHAISGVELVDSSASGLGLLSRARVEVGEYAEIFYGTGYLPIRSGRVTRCEPVEVPGSPMRYRVGLDTGVLVAA